MAVKLEPFDLDTSELESWSVVEVTRQAIEISLVFNDPFEVSQGEQADYIAVDLFFGEFVAITGEEFPTYLSMRSSVPFQIASE